MNDVKYLYFRLQVQIKYLDTVGNQALRVITDERQQTGEKDLAVKESDVRVLGTFAAQSVSQLQARGRFGQARAMLSTYQGFSLRGVRQRHDSSLRTWAGCGARTLRWRRGASRALTTDTSRRWTLHRNPCPCPCRWAPQVAELHPHNILPMLLHSLQSQQASSDS